jgi:hypothetical protein
MKRQGIVRVPEGPLRCLITYFLPCFNRPKYPEMQQLSYRGEDGLPQSTRRGDAPWVRRAIKRMED